MSDKQSANPLTLLPFFEVALARRAFGGMTFVICHLS
jgi:hypothetical protein